MKKILFLIIVLLSFFSLQAKNRKKDADNLPLLNTKWVLKEVFQKYVQHAQDTAFIVFRENYSFSGNLGCNIFFGEFSYGKKRMKIDFCGATKKLCINMEVEEQFFKALKSDITHYYIEKNKLILLSKQTVICKFISDE